MAIAFAKLLRVVQGILQSLSTVTEMQTRAVPPWLSGTWALHAITKQMLGGERLAGDVNGKT